MGFIFFLVFLFIVGYIVLKLYKAFTNFITPTSMKKDYSVEESYSSLTRKKIKVAKESRISISTPDKELVSMTIRTNRHSAKKTGEIARWVLPKDYIEIQGEKITGGNFYYGGFFPDEDDYREDPSLVNPNLKVDYSYPDFDGKNLGYWANYSEIPANSRGTFLKWLASDRSNPDINIGYVFIYFYGIERRLLIDYPAGNVSKEEFDSLVSELERLKTIYGSDNSFSHYISNFLSYLWVVHNRDNGLVPCFDKILYQSYGYSDVFRYYLSKFVIDNGVINEELSFIWILSNPEYGLRTPARRCKKEFELLFRDTFNKKFPEGMKITPNKTNLKIEYSPASSSMYTELVKSYLTLDMPDISVLKSPFNKIAKIAEECTEKLDAYSRFLGRKGNKESLEAIALLPEEIFSNIKNEKVEVIKKWLDGKITDKNYTCKVSDLLKQFGDEAPIKINKNEAEFFANILEKLGYGIAPDVRYHAAKPDLNGYCALFRGGHGKHFDPRPEFKQLGTIVRLGAIVAASDNHIDDSEIEVLTNLINDNRKINNIEKDSLIAYMHWRLVEPVNMAGLKAKIEELPIQLKEMVKSIMITVALADGKMMASEIKQIEKLYKSLGFDPSEVTSDIHNLSFQKGPTTMNNTEREKTGKVSLNKELLNVYEKETEDVKSILGTIFEDDDLEDSIVEEDIIEMTEDKDDANNTSLDVLHSQLYKQLITKEEWVYDDVKQICDQLKLMISGAIETINDWSFDIVDAAVIDEDDVIYIDMEVVEEIKGIN